MDLQLNNEINKTVTNEKNNEVNTFIEELNNSLKKGNQFSTVIANEIYNKNPLAIKYKNQLEDIVEKCMKILSYENDFCYFDYDKKNNIYYLNEYANGNVDRIEYTENEFKRSNFELGSFWEPYGNQGKIVEANYIRNAVAVEVDMELHNLESKNRE